MTQAGVDISSYTTSWYVCPADGYAYYSGGANVGTGTILRISGPQQNYDRAMRVFAITAVNGYGSCNPTFVRKGMSIRVEQCTGGAYAYFRSIE